ncbi:MAG: hypothetical protein COC09_04660, partial [Gammaproteobacteria bacterium]
KSWLLSLDLKQKLVPNREDCLLYCQNDYGPTFGGGHDLHIADQCDTNSNSYANIGHTKAISGEARLAPRGHVALNADRPTGSINIALLEH